MHTSLSEVPEAEWNALLRPEDTPFLDHRFLHGLELTHCVGERAGWIPHHLTFRDEGRLVAAAPAYIKTNSEGEFIFDWGWAEASERAGIPYYPKLVVAVPFTPATGSRLLVAEGEDRALLLRVFARGLQQLFEAETFLSSVHVLFTDEQTTRAFADEGYLVRFGLQYHFKNPGYSDFEDFLATLPTKKRTQIRRERRRPAEEGILIRTLAPAELTPEIARTMHAIYLTTVDKFAWGRRYLNVKFFQHLAEHLPEPQRWVVAEREGAIIAGAVNVGGDHVLYGRYWGAFEEHPFLHFATCYYHGIEECILQKNHTFEPGAGGEHKRPRGFNPAKTRSAHLLRDPRLARAVDEFVSRERVAIDRLLAEEAEAAAAGKDRG